MYIVFPDDYEFLNISKPDARKFKEEDSNGKLSAVISDFLIPDFLNQVLNNSKNKDGNSEIDGLFKRDEFDYAKPENLIKSIIEVASNEGDIILDFFLGSGTTAAVAHKMKRQYIGIEQMDYIETLPIRRLEKVIGTKDNDGLNVKIIFDENGISKSVNWQGGGEFVYCELTTANQLYVDSILKSNTKEELIKIWNQIQGTGFMSWKINPNEINETVNDFIALDIDDMKKFLIESLDKNMLYVPFSEIDNSEFQISDSDKKINKDWYSKK